MRIQYRNNSNNIEIICKCIRHIMLGKNIKQKDIAVKTGLSKTTVSNLLNARQSNITLDTLLMICNAIDCKLYIDIADKDLDNSTYNI